MYIKYAKAKKGVNKSQFIAIVIQKWLSYEFTKAHK